MLCEICHEREAHVRITKIMNGNSETHNVCEVCAAKLRPDSEQDADQWSKAIFKLLTEAVMQHMGPKISPEEQEKMAGMVCPTCHMSYGEFLENGSFGCADCYEAFEPSLLSAVIRIQGADRHTGKKADLKIVPKNRRKENPENEKLSLQEEMDVLQAKLTEAVSIEDYASAARYRDELNRLKEKAHG